MFSKFTLFVAAAFAACAFAGAPEYKCNIGKLQCCGQYQAPTSTEGKQFIKSLSSVPVEKITGQVGTQCNPITAIGKGNGAGCSSAPTCCDSVYQNQRSVGVNCNPATVIA